LRQPAGMPRIETFDDAIAWQICEGLVALIEATRGHGGIEVWHEDLCAGPMDGFARLFSALDLPWDENVKDMIDRLNRPGNGFVPARIAKSESAKWKSELDKESIGRFAQWLSAFNLEAVLPEV
jgi:hypothetical protein